MWQREEQWHHSCETEADDCFTNNTSTAWKAGGWPKGAGVFRTLQLRPAAVTESASNAQLAVLLVCLTLSFF